MSDHLSTSDCAVLLAGVREAGTPWVLDRVSADDAVSRARLTVADAAALVRS